MIKLDEKYRYRPYKYTRYPFRKLMELMPVILATGTLTYYVYTKITGMPSGYGERPEIRLTREWADLRQSWDSMQAVIAAKLDTLEYLRIRDTASLPIPHELRSVQDTLSELSKRLDILDGALTPQSLTDVMTLQRLGDKYEYVIRSIDELKNELEKSRSAFDQALEIHANRVESELDRFTPMIWGILGTIVLIVIQNLWVQRRSKPDQ